MHDYHISIYIMTKDELKRFVYVSIISADNFDLEEDVKQDILHRYDDKKDINEQDWDYVLDPITDKELRNRYIKLLKHE